MEPETDKTVKLLFDSSQHVKPYMSRVVSIYFTPTERAEEQDQGPDETENQEPQIKTVGTFISTDDFLERNVSLVSGHKAQKMYTWLLYTLHSTVIVNSKPQLHATTPVPLAIVQPTKVLVNEELFAHVLSFMNAGQQRFEDTGCFADTNHDTQESDVAHFLDQLHNARPINRLELARPSEAEIELRDTLWQWSRAAENHLREYQRDTIRAYTEFERGEKTKIEYRQAIEKIEQEYKERLHQLEQTLETLTKNSDLKAETDNEQNAPLAPLAVSPSNNTPSNIPTPSVHVTETMVDSSLNILKAQAQPKHNTINYYADAHTATIQLIPACVTTTGLCVLFKYRDNIYNSVSRYLKKITKIFKKTRKKTRRKTARPSTQPESKKIQKY